VKALLKTVMLADADCTVGVAKDDMVCDGDGEADDTADDVTVMRAEIEGVGGALMVVVVQGESESEVDAEAQFDSEPVMEPVAEEQTEMLGLGVVDDEGTTDALSTLEAEPREERVPDGDKRGDKEVDALCVDVEQYVGDPEADAQSDGVPEDDAVEV